MDFNINEVTGIGEYTIEDLMVKERKEGKIFLAPNGKAFCVLHEGKTIEVRTDANLSKVLREKYGATEDECLEIWEMCAGLREWAS